MAERSTGVAPSVTVETESWPNGTPKRETNCADGQRHGWEITFHPNGQRATRRRWALGEPLPPGQRWDPDGNRLAIKPDLAHDTCIFCGACVGVCPTNAMFLEYNNRDIWIDENCTDCLLCVRICPVGALTYPAVPQLNTTRTLA